MGERRIPQLFTSSILLLFSAPLRLCGKKPHRPTGIHFVPLISSIVNRPSKTQMRPEKKEIPMSSSYRIKVGRIIPPSFIEWDIPCLILAINSPSPSYFIPMWIGSPITERPSSRSLRAVFPHRALRNYSLAYRQLKSFRRKVCVFLLFVVFLCPPIQAFGRRFL